jgi:hypothetical protein
LKHIDETRLIKMKSPHIIKGWASHDHQAPRQSATDKDNQTFSSIIHWQILDTTTRSNHLEIQTTTPPQKFPIPLIFSIIDFN